MKRALLTTCFTVFAALASPAAAEDAGQRVQDAIVAQLSAQGFTRVRISTTFLGRVRIYATGPGASREIIVNPRTGEILRDYWDDDDDLDDGLVSPSASGGVGSSTPRGDSDAGTDDREDDRDDDRSDDGASADDGDSGDDGDDDKDDDEKDDKDEKDDDEDDDEGDDKEDDEEDD